MLNRRTRLAVNQLANWDPHMLVVPPANINAYKGSLQYQGPVLWNQLTIEQRKLRTRCTDLGNHHAVRTSVTTSTPANLFVCLFFQRCTDLGNHHGCRRPFKCGDQCRYACVPGCVRQRGATVRTCRHGRYWIGGKRLKCSCSPCSGPPVIRNADVIWGSGCSAPFTAGTTCSYQCDHGYRKVGGAETKMCVDGGWRGSSLDCDVVQCPARAAPANGAVSPIGAVSYPNGVTFTCNTGYVLNGASTPTCQADGTWSHPVPTCTLVQCPARAAPSNGAVSPIGAVSYPNGVTFTCNTGYVLNGASTPTCRADGTWSHPVPTCTPVQCPARAAPANGAVSPTGAVSYPNSVTFTCNTGYILNGDASATCRADGTWSHPVPVCTGQAEPEPSGEPEGEPEPSVEPEPEGEPEPSGEPEPEGEPEPSGEPEPEGEPEPSVEPEPEGEPEPELEPEGEPEPELEPEGEPEPELEPEGEPEPSVEPEPEGEPEPEPEPEGEPEPELEPEGEPEPSVEPEPEGEPEPEPEPEGEPEPELEPEGEPEPELEPEGEPEPSVGPEPEGFLLYKY
ncbi:hypothetical protein Bbelb_081640 [Branchiostoma belcheri]|nr:hypothetical protein Bbelb_081640 [Branchiostoma belcheri]